MNKEKNTVFEHQFEMVFLTAQLFQLFEPDVLRSLTTIKIADH